MFGFNTIKEKRFVVFCWTRTGGSNFANILSLHDAIDCVSEPFNVSKGVVSKIPVIEKELISILDEEIWSEFNGIKHNHGLSEELNKELLKKYTVVFLWRKNALQRAVSNEVAKQTRVWGFNEKREEKIEILSKAKLEEIPISIIQSEVDAYLTEVFLYRDYLVQKKIPFFEIVYEDLFGEGLTLDSKIDLIQDVIEFIGFSKIENPIQIEEIKWRLAPENMKQSRYIQYSEIPNFEALKKLGNDKIGYL